jgi:hypothetical protein
MRNFFGRIKDFLFFTFFGLFWGFIGGLMVAMGIYAARYKPFWCLGVTAFFMCFHLSDFQSFFRKKNWMAMTGRFFALFAIASGIVSLLVFSLAFKGMDILDAFGFLILVPVSIFIVTFYVLLRKYGSHTRLYRELEKIVDGLHVLGVLWKN